MDLQIYTLGCRLNKAESQLWQNQVRTLRIGEGSPWQNRQVIIVNTCVVTAKAEKETRQLLRRLRRENPQALMVAVGCWVESQQRNMGKLGLKKLTSQLKIDILVGNKEKKYLIKKILALCMHRTDLCNLDSKNQDRFTLSGRYFVKIQDGCDKFCSYCIVPLLRGRSESRAAEEIVAQVKELEKYGAREITLTGVDIAQYKTKNKKPKIKDKKTTGLVKLLERILQETEIPRIRLGSIYPEAFTSELLKLYQEQPLLASPLLKGRKPFSYRLCRHFHISLQSGCDATLARMNRHYTVEEFTKTLKRIRQAIPGVNITTDVIVGFPGETEEEFEESYGNIKRMGFGKIHVFPYSARPGTLAAKMEKEWGRIPNKIKWRRSRKMRGLSDVLNRQFKQQFIGKELTILLEHQDKEGYWWGLSDNYLRVKLEKIKGENMKVGEIIKLKIEKLGDNFLEGKLIFAVNQVDQCYLP